MKKLFMLLLSVVIVLGLSDRIFASYPNSITIDSYLNGCMDYNNCVNDTLYKSNVLKQSFGAGSYILTVDPSGGAWSSYNSPDSSPQWLDRHWFWSLYVYNPQTNSVYGDPGPTLGSNNDYISGNSAIAQFNSFNNHVTIDVAADGDLWFYIKDRNPRDNIGSVAVNVAVVPEPVSSSLFIIGGAVFAGRRFLKKKK